VMEVLSRVLPQLLAREFSFRPGDVERVREQVAPFDSAIHLLFESRRLQCLHARGFSPPGAWPSPLAGCYRELFAVPKKPVIAARAVDVPAGYALVQVDGGDDGGL
jgi:hypothetical protein